MLWIWNKCSSVSFRVRCWSSMVLTFIFSAIVERVKEVAQPDWKPPPEATLVLTKDNFDDVVNNADIILVEFYAPWFVYLDSCASYLLNSWCNIFAFFLKHQWCLLRVMCLIQTGVATVRGLAPEYEKAAKELSNRTPPIPLAKVDATAESDLATRFDVSGYPTLKIFRKGKAFDYNGPREKFGRSINHRLGDRLIGGVGNKNYNLFILFPLGIVDYMSDQSGPPSKQVQTLKQVQEIVRDGDDSVICRCFLQWRRCIIWDLSRSMCVLCCLKSFSNALDLYFFFFFYLTTCSLFLQVIL